MTQTKVPEIRIPKQYADSKRLVAVPETQYKKFVAFQKEHDDVIDIISRAEEDLAAGRTRTITAASQLKEL